MPNRKYEQQGKTYRYGLNGQEKTPEVSENSFTAEFWQYDARIGRRWNVDPVVKEWESPYLAFNGNPILIADPAGNDGSPSKKNGMGDIEGPSENNGYQVSMFSYQENGVYKQLQVLDVEGMQDGIRKVGITAAIAGAVVADIFFTKGLATRYVLGLYTATQTANIFEHNRAKTPEGRAAQDERTNAAFKEAIGGVGMNKIARVLTKVSVSTTKFVYKAFSTTSIRTTQTTVNGVEKYVEQFSKAGKYNADPIDIVKMEDGIYSSVDHARLMAAEKLGLEAKANAHNFKDPIPYKRAREIAGEKVSDADLPKTWGEAIKVRVSGQGPKYANENPNGTFNRPKVKS